MPSTYYDVLEVASDASTEEIKQAYRRMVKRVHPDTSSADHATMLFQELQQAYQTLIDARQRQLYDAHIAADQWQRERKAPFTLRFVASHERLPFMHEPQMLYVLIEIGTSQNVKVQRAPLNICLVLDRSLSMEGARIARAKDAATYLIDRLDPEDILSVVAFGDRARTVVSGQKGDDRAAAKASVRAIQPHGGTELLQGVNAGLDELRRARNGMTLDHLILLTDGQTYGDDAGCLAAAESAAGEKIGMTLLGLGADWNDELLDAMAARSGGYSTYVDSPDRLTAAFDVRFAELTAAVARDLQLTAHLHRSVLLEHAYRLTPDIVSLSFKDNRVGLGTLESQRGLRALLALKVSAEAVGALRALRVDVEGELLQGAHGRSSVDGEIKVDVVAQADPDTGVPREIEEALAQIAMYTVQEKAQADVARGDHASATTRLQNLATQLLNMGEAELARAALLEAGTLTRTGSMSAEGRKRVRYGTRTLSRSPGSRGEPE